MAITAMRGSAFFCCFSAGTFANSPRLVSISIPESVTEIAADAFDGCNSLKIICSENSFAQEYAELHGIPYVIR